MAIMAEKKPFSVCEEKKIIKMAGRTLHVPRLASTFLVWRSSVELKVVWMGPSNCIVSEFYAHCDVITHHLKMAVGTPSLVVQLPHVNMPVYCILM